jgi:hypothetical protein
MRRALEVCNKKILITESFSTIKQARAFIILEYFAKVMTRDGKYIQFYFKKRTPFHMPEFNLLRHNVEDRPKSHAFDFIIPPLWPD